MRFVASLIAAVAALVAVALAPAAEARAATPRFDRPERAVVRAIVRQRARAGLARVHRSRRLARAADYHSREMLAADYFAHTSRNGGPMERRLRRFSHSHRLGETLAMIGGRCGRHFARRVVRMWMHSPGHRAILLSPDFRRVGIGRRTGHLDGRRACMVTADFSK